MAEAAPADPSDNADAIEKRRLATCAQRWIGEINASEKAQVRWLNRARKIARLYKRERNDTEFYGARYAMLWSNTQTIQPAIYSRPPKPVVGRRFKAADPVGRVVSEVLEHSLSYSIDQQDLDGVLRMCSFDFALFARGQTWERYVPTHGPQVFPEPIDLQVVTIGDGDGETYQDMQGNTYDAEAVQTKPGGGFFTQPDPYQPVIFEESITDYVNWEDFGHSVSRTWSEVSYVWRRVYLSRDQCIERFGPSLGKLVPLDWGPVEQGKVDPAFRLMNKAAVYEIWDKVTKKVYWISKSWSSRPLDEREDPLGLEDFFPCPRPLLGTTANDSTIPVPDFVFYQDQAEEIDKLTARIGYLQDALKVRGFYAADVKTNLNNLLNSDNNTLIPVPDWVRMKEGGGVRGNIEWFPIDLVVSALNAIIDQRKQLISDVFQITGVSDIQRGESDPRETMGAQKLKANYGSVRVRDRQIEMQRFARDVLRIKGEVIAEKFDPETLKLMSGVKLPTQAEKQAVQLQLDQAKMQLQAQAQQMQAVGQQPPPLPPIPEEMAEVLRTPTWEEVVGLLRDNAKRQFRVDIETDSTIEPDEQEEKARTVEFLGAMGQMIAQWGPAIEAQPLLAPMAGAFIKYGARKFRASTELEDIIDTTVDEIVAAAKEPKAEAAEQPDQTPVQVAVIEQQTAQMQEAAETQRAQMDAALEQQDQQLRAGDQRLKLVALTRDPTPQAQA